MPAAAPPASAPAIAGPVLVHSAPAVVWQLASPPAVDPLSVATDIDSQIAELSDLFPQRPQGGIDL